VDTWVGSYEAIAADEFETVDPAPLLITAKHDQIVPPAYSENLVPDAKTLNSIRAT